MNEYFTFDSLLQSPSNDTKQSNVIEFKSVAQKKEIERTRGLAKSALIENEVA